MFAARWVLGGIPVVNLRTLLGEVNVVRSGREPDPARSSLFVVPPSRSRRTLPLTIRRRDTTLSCYLLGRNPQLSSALGAKSANRSRLTRYLPPKNLTRKVSRRLSVIQALATHLSVA
jgi:hypothetical protein